MKIENFGTPTAVLRELRKHGIKLAKSTLNSACDRNDKNLKQRRLIGGLRVVEINSVRSWIRHNKCLAQLPLDAQHKLWASTSILSTDT